jgi:TPR repeat protein
MTSNLGRGFLVALGVVSILVVGCGKTESAEKGAIRAYYVDADQAAAAAKGENLEDPSKVGPKSSDAGNPSLKDLTDAHDKAAAAYAKAHSDPKAKDAYVAATVRLATATMVSEELGPKEKYRKALKFYREALKVDPTNVEAKNNSEEIISIYKQMGRPVPE